MTGALVLTLAARAVRTITASDRYASWRGNAFDAVVEQNHGRPRTDELEAPPAVRSVRSVTFVFGGLIPEGG
ncbi:MAG TPA: hypothetical protein VGQ20_02435, partial [Acidimicrobiales bacterium]|nr:hypothetical protein [Acidimicrobiales bacterium]